MIVKFVVENYQSIYDKLELDFRVASHNKPDIDKEPFVLKIGNDYISKLCLFYGDNGAGKSNILEALYYLCLCNKDNKYLEYLSCPHISHQNEESKFELQFYSNKLSKSKKYSLFTYKLCIKREKDKIIVLEESLYKDTEVIFWRIGHKLVTDFVASDNTILIPYNKTFLLAIKDIYMNQKIQNKINKYIELFKLLPSSKMPLDTYDFYIDMLKIANVDIKLLKKSEYFISDGIKCYAEHLYTIVMALREGALSLHNGFSNIQSDLVKTLFLLFTKDRYKEIEQTAQLFAITHDIELMNFSYLLLEQINFVIKDQNKTYVYLASKIQGLNKDNLVESYRENKLGGKYMPRAYDIPIKMFKEKE